MPNKKLIQPFSIPGRDRYYLLVCHSETNNTAFLHTRQRLISSFGSWPLSQHTDSYTKPSSGASGFCTDVNMRHNCEKFVCLAWESELIYVCFCMWDTAKRVKNGCQFLYFVVPESVESLIKVIMVMFVYVNISQLLFIIQTSKINWQKIGSSNL